MELAVGENYYKHWSDTRPKTSQAKKSSHQRVKVLVTDLRWDFFTKIELVKREKKKKQ